MTNDSPLLSETLRVACFPEEVHQLSLVAPLYLNTLFGRSHFFVTFLPILNQS
ncbi:hypothetical protein [Nostoc sp.]|uniref:hypothetical protein n=1 Tax=Nostoc sp. TaxID=1180 RepID=UPI002FF7B7F3